MKENERFSTTATLFGNLFKHLENWKEGVITNNFKTDSPEFVVLKMNAVFVFLAFVTAPATLL